MKFILETIGFIASMALLWYSIEQFTCAEILNNIGNASNGSFLLAIGAFILGTFLLIRGVGKIIFAYLIDNACRDK